MKFVLAAHGTRGDIEPCATVGAELRRRGHDVAMAVPPNLVEFVEAAGVPAVSYGPDTREQVEAVADFTHNAFTPQNPVHFLRDLKKLFVEGWAEMGRTLTSLADGADLVLTGQTYHGVVANVAEYYDIPIAGLHHFPVRVNGQIGVPFLPSPPPAVRTTLRAGWWLYSRITKADEDAQRRELGLPRTPVPAWERMARNGTLEIQAYDRALFPALAAEWEGRRPFVGALTLELAADDDDEVASWIAAGKPPIYFGFGSTPVKSPAETVAMIADACAELGERALVYSDAPAAQAPAPHGDHVRLVGQVNYSTILPMCRAAVHHGGAGTVAASLRAGLPTLILWDVADQFIWATQVERLKVGSAKRLSKVSRRSLVSRLRRILAPDCVARAREIAPRMTKPSVGVATAADLLEQTVRVGV